MDLAARESPTPIQQGFNISILTDSEKHRNKFHPMKSVREKGLVSSERIMKAQYSLNRQRPCIGEKSVVNTVWILTLDHMV